MDVDAGFRASRGSDVDTWLCSNARGRDGCFRQELGAEVVQLTPKTEAEATSILPSLIQIY
jgi:hypothetical protein